MHNARPPQGETHRWPRRRSRQEGACWKRGGSVCAPCLPAWWRQWRTCWNRLLITAWKRSMTIGLGGSSPRRATVAGDNWAAAVLLRDSSDGDWSTDCATRAASGRADLGVHSLVGGAAHVESSACQTTCRKRQRHARSTAADHVSGAPDECSALCNPMR
jgi:hypothetical protein